MLLVKYYIGYSSSLHKALPYFLIVVPFVHFAQAEVQPSCDLFLVCLVPIWILLELHFQIADLFFRQAVSTVHSLQSSVWVFKLLINNEVNFLSNRWLLLNFVILIVDKSL